MADSLVPIYIMGKRYEVPQGLTIMSALEWAGYQLIRGCGCRGGFCGACATVYRVPGNFRIHVGMACQTAFWQQLTATDGYGSLSRYFLSRFEVGRLGDTEVKETIARSLAKTGISFDPDVLDLVCRHVAGHPFEMQVLCHHLFNNQMSRRVRLEAWESALARALRDLGVGVFNRMLSAVGHEELRVLRAVAQMDMAATVADIAGRCGVDSQSSDIDMVKEHLSILVRKSLVTHDSHGRYAAADPMLKAYVCRSHDRLPSG